MDNRSLQNRKRATACGGEFGGVSIMLQNPTPDP
jgi:hypothetical protein